MTIVKGITDQYAHQLSRDLQNELRRMVEQGVFTVVSSDYFSTVYQNLKPSLIETVPDADYVYITDTANDINNFYKITPE